MRELKAKLKRPDEYIPLKRKNYNLVEEQKRSGSIELKGFPYWLTIDPANYCNLSCPLCPTGQKRGSRNKRSLSMDVFKKVLDELGPYLIHIDLCNWGEPLLNENIFDMIVYAKRYGIDIKLDTNINILDHDGPEKLVRSGLDKMILSIDGASSETYAKYRQGGDFNKVMENVRRIVDKKKQTGSATPVLEWQFLVFRHNEHEMDKAREKAREMGVDEINFTAPYAGSLEWLTTIESFRSKYYDIEGSEVSFKKPDRDMRCNWLWDAVTINSDGSVSPCCSVEDGADDFFKNFSDEDFSSIWNDKKYKDARKRITEEATAESGDENICLRCDHWGWSNHMDVEHILHKMEEGL